MIIDERYVKILADATLSKYSKWTPRLAGLGFVLLAFGAMVAFGGNSWGIGIAAGGVALIIVGAYRKKREDDVIAVKKQEFMDYVKKRGLLPPFPEIKK